MLSRSLNMFNSSNPSPPSISLTPATTQNRSRSGTLPTSYYANHSNNFQPNSSPLISSLDPLGLPTMDQISLGLSPNVNAVDIPTNTSTRRMRSGSLFSTSSIWNDDAIPASPGLLDNSSIHSASSGSFLSPRLTAQPLTNPVTSAIPNMSSNSTNGTNGSTTTSTAPPNNAPRNRSYTTTGAVSNILPNGNYTMDLVAAGRLLPTSGMTPSGPLHDLTLDSLLNNLNVNGSAPRHRSQTFSGSTPNMSEATLHLGPNPNLNDSTQAGHSFLGQNNILGQSNNSLQSHLMQQQLQHQQQHQSQIQTQMGQQTQPQPQHPLLLLLSQQMNDQLPYLQDDFDISKVSITTNFENPNLAPTRFVLFDNLPHFVDALKMWSILSSSIGSHRVIVNIRSIRVASLNTSKIALVECVSVDVAMNVKASFNHMELIPGIVIYVAFAKFELNEPVVSNMTSTAASGVLSTSPHNASTSGATGVSNTASTKSSSTNGRQQSSEVCKPCPTDIVAIEESLLNSIQQLSTSSDKKVDLQKIVSLIKKSIAYSNDNYQDNFGPLPDPIPIRQFDSPKLRDLRKVLEHEELSSSAGHSSSSEDEGSHQKIMTQLELEELCLAMLDELPELCYDYLGNTIIQKIFCVVESPLIKLMMVKEITPYLTQLGIHKNGTWAIQKIISLCQNDYQQKYLIAASLKPYAVKLFNDQFGNYVLQGCLKFGTPFNDFIFETVLDNFLEISFGRFGARSIRTILETANENNIVSKEQILLVAGLIVQYANELVVNSNGSLLITWFLDTYNSNSSSDDRFKLLSAKLLPNLEQLCCHKLANLTILKILNNRMDYFLKQLIMDEIFGRFNEFDEELSPVPSVLLERILSENLENSAGPVFIYKILSNPTLLTIGEERETSGVRNTKYLNFVLLQIRRILLELNISNVQPYKKLMDEVGLSNTRLNRSASLNGNRRSKRGGRNNNRSNHNGNLGGNQQYGHQQQQQVQLQQQQPQQHQYVDQHHVQRQHQQSQPQLHQQYSVAPQLSNQYQHQYQMLMAQQLSGSGQVPTQMQGQDFYLQQQDQAVMQQLEQLSLSSAAMGYNSNPDTPNIKSSQRTLFL